MKVFLSLLVLAGLLFHGMPGCAHDSEDGEILRVEDGRRLSLSEIVEDLKGVQMVFVGELHNSAMHHELQLKVIRALTDAGASIALGLEMFRQSSQKDLDQWVAGGVTEGDFQRIFHENWGYHWDLYRDIFVYARNQHLPMIGLNVSSDITRQVASHGFASLSPEQTGDLAGVTCQVDKAYMDFIRQAFGMHGQGGKEFIYFCEAQMVWDAAMAMRLMGFLSNHPKLSVIVLAGSGHAWKHGIPDQVSKRSNLSYRVILPEIPDRAERGKVSQEDTDYLWLTP
jgi:uncharacterized iron-regulated protein